LGEPFFVAISQLFPQLKNKLLKVHFLH